MSSRDRDTKSFQDKLKVFFKKGPAPLPAGNELVVTGELERELGPDTPLHRRLRALKEVADKSLHVRIQEGSVERLWTCTRDLLDDSSVESRHAVLGLMRCVAEGQVDQLQIMRTIFFHYLRDTHPTHNPEDTQLRFKFLHTLTNSGKNINCFEEEIGPFLLEWLPQIQGPPQLVEFLQLIMNVVKFNATYLDEHIVHGIVNNACHLCVYCAEGEVVSASLALLEAVVSYSLLPRAALPAFVAALCRAINCEQYCEPSWKLMRCVLGADIGHAALLEMVRVLHGDASAEHAGLLRGAVFYINMALWGPRRVPTLRVSYLAVLPAYLKALQLGQPVVTFEVVVGVQRAVERAASDLTEPAWDVLLRILRAALDQDRSYDPPNEMIHTRLHALITSIEQMADEGQYSGDPEALLELVDSCGHERPEASAMRLVSARARALSAGRGGWAAAALALGERYLRAERRRGVRLHTLQELVGWVRRNLPAYGGELAELVAVPLLTPVALDADAALRAAAARALTDLAKGAAVDACTDLIDLLEKILNRPFDMFVTDVPIPADADVADLRLACAGLLDLLHDRLLASPPTLPLRCFLVLLDHLENHYKRPALFQHHPDIRLKIFEMLFGLRANQFNCVGFCYDASGQVCYGAASLRLKPVCSPFLVAEGVQRAGGAVLGTARAARLTAAALARDADWAVLGPLLRALPALLAARALCVGRRAQDLDVLAATLCSMVSDRSLAFPERLRVPPPQRLLLSDFHNAVLPALAALAPYHSFLEPQTQQRIVLCLLKYGMVLRCPQPYITALTIFTLETRDTMVKMLPEVLLDLSKISDTQAIAGPMLEFLSTLTRLPKVFASFVEDQYMSVFAILLPYTNPSRYNHYIVSLAHHVIAAWFLKCRLSYRKNFVKFIIHGLHNYIIMPFEEQLQYNRSNFQQGLNEDSSNRQRSSSLGSRAAPRAAAGRAGGGALAAFHVELTETCLDLLARYAASPCAVRPARSDTARFLFDGGHSMTWLVGHKLVTITTSGCQQNPLNKGLCDRCSTLCRQHAESLTTPLPPLAPPDLSITTADTPAPEVNHTQIQVQVSDEDPSPAGEVKRYSKRSLQHSRSTDSSSLSASDHHTSGHSTRQNSSESSKAADGVAEVLQHFSARFARISAEVDSEEATWWRAGALAPGACPCWCAAWAELHVRGPTGDVAWLMRMQNQMNWDYLLESPLQEVAALLAPAIGNDASSVLGESVNDVSSSPPRSSSPNRPMHQDLHKSSSDTVVAAEKKPPHAASHCILPHQHPRMSTQPINIPGSPQRQSSTSTNDDEDLLYIVPEGKSRHPVRRSNSSPEMSSSWKRAPREPEVDDMIVLPGVEPQNPSGNAGGVHKKPVKKSDMRVSCEAIPEEMSGTSPLAHAHAPPHAHAHHALAAHHSDPGVPAEDPPPTPPAPAAPAPALAPPNTHHQLQKTASDGSVCGAELPPLARSKRSNTISVMSPARRRGGGGAAAGGGGGGGGGGAGGGGVTPAFVFLQLYHNMSTAPGGPRVPGEAAPGGLAAAAERPLRVAGEQHERTVKMLDLLPPIETYKVGVLYVGPGQQDCEVAILRNEYGSVRYADFLRQLGTLVALDERTAQPALFLNLETGGKDGQYTYVWHDDIMQVAFHVATAMPNLPSDPNCNEKRKYIGNDFVSIVYNDSGADFNIHTIKGQFNLCIVVVEPHGHGMNLVHVKTKDERIRTEFLAHVSRACVSDANVALLARQHALHAALAAHIAQSLAPGGLPYAGNSLERLRAIKRLRRRLEAERAKRTACAPAPYHNQHHKQPIDDFNDYT